MINRLGAALMVCSGLLMMACNSAESDWNKATTANSASAYRTFLQQHSNDEHADEARDRILAFDDDQAWASALSANTVGGFQGYLQKESGGVYFLEAKARLAALERMRR
jgi:hypothetical protein